MGNQKNTPTTTSIVVSSRDLETPEQAPQQTWFSKLRDDISIPYTDIPVLACCAVSGLCDSVAFNAAGVFVAMQTGNTVLLSLGVASLPEGQPILWIKALVSILSFMFGCFAFSKSRHFQAKRKATLSISFFIQATLILVAAALSQSGIVRALGDMVMPSQADRDSTEWEYPLLLVPVSLLAMSGGGSVVTSRTLGYNEVPTSVLTSLYCDLVSDPLLFSPLKANPKRNRRIAAAILFMSGAMTGAALQRLEDGLSYPLWIAGSIKFVIALAWLAWPAKSSVVEEQEIVRMVP